MRRFGWLIARYLVQAVLPYFLLSWVLLTVVLFVQQASRYADIFFSVNIPAQLVWQLTFALIPNVIAFTCPMAVLVGTIIGLSKMQGDSELVVIRAAGIANWQIMIPVVLLGIVLSLFAFFVNVSGVPFAASIVRRVALQTAIKKLESPIEPGIFNTEVAGYTIYVRGGDVETGRWNGIFIYSKDDASGTVRLITSGEGRVDVSGETSELVLSKAYAYTLPAAPRTEKFVAESIGELRLAVKTKRNELIQRLASAELTPEELGLSQLNDYAAAREGKDRTEAEILWQRRILLSITPVIFCILGASMILRFKRAGRGFGIFLALAGLITYYLFAFLGEQLARTGRLSVLAGGLVPVLISGAAVIWFSFSWRIGLRVPSVEQFMSLLPVRRPNKRKVEVRSVFIDLTTGLRDLDLIINLCRNFLVSLSFLSAIFLIFTAFELWKFAGTMDHGVRLLVEYLFFLLPFVYIQLAPSSAMISVLATYVVKSRQNEIVSWAAAGQSVYRLLLPSFVLMALLGLVNWEIQERILPSTNQTQEELRSKIRNLGAPTRADGRSWFATEKRIYTFTAPSENDKAENIVTNPDSITPEAFASDNVKSALNVNVYQFNSDGTLQTVYRFPSANWIGSDVRLYGSGEKVTVNRGNLVSEIIEATSLDESSNPFAGSNSKPSELDSRELRTKLEFSGSPTEKRSLDVALQKKYATLVIPFVIALFTAPFSLSLNRRSRVVTVGYAVAVWLVFTASMSLFEQYGLSGNIDPKLAVWGPMAIFAVLGIFLLTKVRT